MLRNNTVSLQNTLARPAVRKHAFVGGIMLVALLAFEIFNFDTTKYALNSLLGDVRFLSLQWATILAVAFCAIDFAGLARLFTPQRGADEPREVWYLMGAWLLGATMNAMMTWWAVSLTLLNHEFGNEVLSREQLLGIVPIFVAVLVWLTRILFIGSLSVTGERVLWGDPEEQSPLAKPPRARASSARPAPARRNSGARRARPVPKPAAQARQAQMPPAPTPAEEALRGEISPRQQVNSRSSGSARTRRGATPQPARGRDGDRVRQRPPRWRSTPRAGAD
jgi:hypothetical protein